MANMDVEKTAEREVGEKRHSLASGTTGGEEGKANLIPYSIAEKMRLDDFGNR